MIVTGAQPVPADSTRLRDGFDPSLFITDPDITASYARDRTGAYESIQSRGVLIGSG